MRCANDRGVSAAELPRCCPCGGRVCCSILRLNLRHMSRIIPPLPARVAAAGLSRNVSRLDVGRLGHKQHPRPATAFQRLFFHDKHPTDVCLGHHRPMLLPAAAAGLRYERKPAQAFDRSCCATDQPPPTMSVFCACGSLPGGVQLPPDIKPPI